METWTLKSHPFKRTDFLYIHNALAETGKRDATSATCEFMKIEKTYGGKIGIYANDTNNKRVITIVPIRDFPFKAQ